MRISDWSSDVCSSDLLRCATVGEEWGECSNGGEAQIRVARDQGFQNCQQVGHARLLPSDQITVQLLWVKAYQSDSRGGARRRRATTCCHSRSSRGPKLTVGASSVASIRPGRRRQTEHLICSIIFSGRLFQRCSANQRQRKAPSDRKSAG